MAVECLSRLSSAGCVTAGANRGGFLFSVSQVLQLFHITLFCLQANRFKCIVYELFTYLTPYLYSFEVMRLPDWMRRRPRWLRRNRPVNRTPGNEGTLGIVLKNRHVTAPNPYQPQPFHFRPLSIDHSVWTLVDVYLRWACGVLWLATLVTAIVLSATKQKTAPFVYFSLGLAFFNIFISSWAWWYKRIDPKCLGVFDLIVAGTLLGAVFGVIWILGCSERRIDLRSCTLDPLTLTLFVEILCLLTIYISLMVCAYIGFLIRYRRKKQDSVVFRAAHPRPRCFMTDEEQARAEQHSEDLREKYDRGQSRWYSNLRFLPYSGYSQSYGIR